MAVSVSKAGPYYSSGAISFSSLRSNFRAQVKRTSSGGSESFNSDTSSISASDLLRITSTSNTNPVVPNATENANIVTSQSNWSASHFRNSIKFYYVILPNGDTVENFDIDSQSWNSNLNKNVNKIMFIDGNCGSDDVTSPAATFNATAHNFTINVDGNIAAAGGRGGGSTGAPAISGEDGGDALSVSTSGNNVVVNITSSGKIYGGGGGGEKGVKGDDGSPGSCYQSTTKEACKNCPGCDGGWNSGNCWDGWHCERQQVCGCWGDCWWESTGNTKYRECNRSASVNGGTGGDGGNGRHGRGYDYLLGSLTAIDGDPGGSKESCPFGSYSTTPTDGKDGKKGGKGGNWAEAGGNTTNTGSGGAGGDAIIGSGYSVTGSTGSSNIKGSY